MFSVPYTWGHPMGRGGYPTKIGILGTGSVARALAVGFSRGKHEVWFGSRDPARAKIPSGTHVRTQREAAQWAEIVVLAVPYHAVKQTVDSIGAASLAGKVLVDATNAIGLSGNLAVGLTTSAAEELLKLAPGARVVKAFNTVFASNMASGKVGQEALTLFVAGDDPKAKETVMALGGALGFEPVDAGPLRSARYLEPMALQLITMAYGLKMGPAVGFRLVRAGG